MSIAFTIRADLLADTAGWLERLIPNRPHVPVLGGARLTVDDHGLTAAAFDFDTAGTVTVDADVDQPGTVLVSGKLLAAIARAAPKTANVRVVCDQQQATLTAGRSEWALPLLPLDNYPALPDLGPAVGSIDAAVLADAVARVLPAAGRDDTLPMLTGVKVECDDGTNDLTLTATDRFRLATTTVPWNNTRGGLDLLVPAGLLAQMVRGATGTLQLHADTAGSASGFGAAAADRRVTGRLLDAQFPRWRALLTHDTGHYATVDTAGLREALDQVAVYGDKTLRMNVTGERVELSAAEDQRSARADTPVLELAGEPVTVGINPTYLRDAIAGLGEVARVFLPPAGSRKPLLFVPDEDHDGYRHLLMPVTLSEAERAA